MPVRSTASNMREVSIEGYRAMSHDEGRRPRGHWRESIFALDEDLGGAGPPSAGLLRRAPSPPAPVRFHVPAARPPCRAPSGHCLLHSAVDAVLHYTPRIAAGGRSRAPKARQPATSTKQKFQSQASDRIAARASRPPSAVTFLPLAGLDDQHGSQAVTYSLSCIVLGGGRSHGRRPPRSPA